MKKATLVAFEVLVEGGPVTNTKRKAHSHVIATVIGLMAATNNPWVIVPN